MNQETVTSLCKLLADTYALYLKTQNYHWHIKGPNFISYHKFLDDLYHQLADAVDEIAERIVTLGGTAPASFSQFSKLTTMKDGNSNQSAEAMFRDLYQDHQKMLDDLNKVISHAEESHDEGTAGLLSNRIAEHEKIHWMLRSIIS